jgi:hypothetical protein
MPYLLRKIRKARWYKGSVAWLQKDLPQADALVDLSTKNNRLSVWLITDDKSNLNRIIAALACACETVSNLDYALIDIADLNDLGLQFDEVPGDSADDLANKMWHRDLIELSAKSVYDLVCSLHARATTERVTENQIKQLVKQGLQSSVLDRSRIRLKESALTTILSA